CLSKRRPRAGFGLQLPEPALQGPRPQRAGRRNPPRSGYEERLSAGLIFPPDQIPPVFCRHSFLSRQYDEATLKTWRRTAAMSTMQANAILRQVRRWAARQGSGSTADGELVRRFAIQRDEAAFAGLVQRHGAMVLRVCRGVLRDAHDADDAFQATFL